MSHQLDTNILTRWSHREAADHELAIAAILSLTDRNEPIVITPQNLVEFWSVATRPAEANGLGMTPSRAAREVEEFLALFELLPDIPAIFTEWLNLVSSLEVRGRQVHDARIAAVMRVHGISHLLTFNVADFARYPGITVVHPRDVSTADEDASHTPEPDNGPGEDVPGAAEAP